MRRQVIGKRIWQGSILLWPHSLLSFRRAAAVASTCTTPRSPFVTSPLNRCPEAATFLREQQHGQKTGCEESSTSGCQARHSQEARREAPHRQRHKARRKNPGSFFGSE